VQRALAGMAQAAAMAGLPPPRVLSLERDRLDDLVGAVNRERAHLLAFLVRYGRLGAASWRVWSYHVGCVVAVW
jgi:hypothetical protein